MHFLLGGMEEGTRRRGIFSGHAVPRRGEGGQFNSRVCRIIQGRADGARGSLGCCWAGPEHVLVRSFVRKMGSK